MNRKTRIWELRLAVAMAASGILSPAMAHPGHSYQSFQNAFIPGFLHSFSGWDHLIVIFAIGMIAVHRQSKGLALCFPILMVFGALMARLMNFGDIGGIELTWIVGLFFAAMSVAFLRHLSIKWVAIPAGLTGITMGFVHGREIPSEMESGSFITGFVVATMVVLAISAILARGLQAYRNRSWNSNQL